MTKEENKEWKPCGDGDNICNCKKSSECGYILIEKGIIELLESENERLNSQLLEKLEQLQSENERLKGEREYYAQIQIEKDRERIVKNSSPFDLSILIDNTPINLD